MQMLISNRMLDQGMVMLEHKESEALAAYSSAPVNKDDDSHQTGRGLAI